MKKSTIIMSDFVHEVIATAAYLDHRSVSGQIARWLELMAGTGPGLPSAHNDPASILERHLFRSLTGATALEMSPGTLDAEKARQRTLGRLDFLREEAARRSASPDHLGCKVIPFSVTR